jgi:hypothetical protein
MFTGIRAHDVPAFVLAQLVGAFVALGVARWLFALPESTVSSDTSDTVPSRLDARTGS